MRDSRKLKAAAAAERQDLSSGPDYADGETACVNQSSLVARPLSGRCPSKASVGFDAHENGFLVLGYALG